MSQILTVPGAPHLLSLTQDPLSADPLSDQSSTTDPVADPQGATNPVFYSVSIPISVSVPFSDAEGAAVPTTATEGATVTVPVPIPVCILLYGSVLDLASVLIIDLVCLGVQFLILSLSLI